VARNELQRGDGHDGTSDVAEAPGQFEPWTSMGRCKWCDGRHARAVSLQVTFQVADVRPLSLAFQENYDCVISNDRPLALDSALHAVCSM
jgi:hypothetical protein